MNKLSSCTVVNFWFRPIGFPSKKFTATVSQISRWAKEEKPNPFKSISPSIYASGLFALIGGISSILGFLKDNKYAKWGGGASILAGLTLYITSIFKALKADKASEETSKSLKTITDEKDDTNRKKMIDDLIAENNSDDLLQALKDILRDITDFDSIKGTIEIISHLSNGHSLILDIVTDKTYSSEVRRSAVFAMKNTGEEERKVLISILKDEKGEFRDAACYKLGEYSDDESYKLLLKCLKDEDDNSNVKAFSLSSILKRKYLGYIEDLAKLLEEKDFSDRKKDDVLKKILNLPVEEIKTHVLELLSIESKLSVDELKALESSNDEKYAHLLFNSLGNKNISYLSKLMTYDALKDFIKDKDLSKEFAQKLVNSLMSDSFKPLNQNTRKFNDATITFSFKKDLLLGTCPLKDDVMQTICLFKRSGWLFKEEIKDS